MDGPRDYHTKGSKSERERQKPYVKSLMNSLIYEITYIYIYIYVESNI